MTETMYVIHMCKVIHFKYLDLDLVWILFDGNFNEHYYVFVNSITLKLDHFVKINCYKYIQCSMLSIRFLPKFFHVTGGKKIDWDNLT